MVVDTREGLLPVRGPVLHLVRGVLGGSQAEDLEGQVVTVHHLSEVQIDHIVDVVAPGEVLLVGLADAAAARGPRHLEVEDTGPAGVLRVIYEVGGGAPVPLHAGGQAAEDLSLSLGAHTRAGRILTPALGQDHEHRVRVVAPTPPLAAVRSVALEAVRSRAVFLPRPRETTVPVVLNRRVIAAMTSGTADRVATALKKTNKCHFFANHLFGHYGVIYSSNTYFPKAPVFGSFNSCHQNHLGQMAC